MTLEIALSLFTFASVILFVHIKIKKNRESIFGKMEDDKKRIENEINTRLNFIEKKQLQSLETSIDKIESKRLVQQDALEEIKIKATKNNDEFNCEIKSLQRQIQQLTQCIGELQQKFSEISSLKSLQNPKVELDEMQNMPFGRISGLDKIDELARAAKEKNQVVTESEKPTNETGEISKNQSVSSVETTAKELVVAAVAGESNPIVDSSLSGLNNNSIELNTTIENDNTTIIGKINESLVIEDKADIVEKLEIDSIEVSKTKSVEEVENDSVEVETTSTPEVAASSIQVTEPDNLLMTMVYYTESGKTTLRDSRSKRYELIRQTVKKIQPIAQALRPAHRSTERSESTVTRTRILAPSVLAFHNSGQWEFFVELPKQTIPQEKIAYLAQGQIKLDYQEKNLFGPLRHLDIAIEICLENSGKRIKTIIGLISNNNPVLIFRLTDDDSDWKGALVSKISKGFYLAIAPNNWKRDEENGGYPPADPELLNMDRLTAHYFDTQEDQGIYFIKPDEKQYKKKPSKIDFVLTGQCINDAEERMGPLFHGEFPSILGNYNLWKDIRSIVIGEEGQGDGQWREHYDIEIFRNHSWQIPSLGPKGNSGWFFARIYDYTGRLLSSLPFRFVRGLQYIETSISVFPGYRQERPARVEFDITDKIYVTPIDNSAKLTLETDDKNHKITFICKPIPNIQKLTFQVQETDGKPVRVTIDVDRLWWRICDEHTVQNSVQWSALLLSKAKSAFSPTAGNTLELHLPSSLIKQPIKIGFQRENALNLQISLKEKLGKAPLHWFYDHVSTKIGKQKLGVWIGNDEDCLYFELLEYITHINCQYCSKIFEEKSAFLEHLLNEHDHQFFQSLTIKKHYDFKSTPETLYICPLDGVFFWKDPFREIEQHFRTKHPRDRFSFRVINDLDAIQRIESNVLEHVWKCLKCEDILAPPNNDPSARSIKRQHLLTKHQHEINQLNN